MATASSPTSIRLNPDEKRRISSLARKRGLSPSAYIKRAALAGPVQSEDSKLARLERIAATVLEAVEDERDARLGDARWEKHLAGKARLMTRKEFRR
jgi:predicted transcriptional regulator